jgi:3-oxoacyl-[acyl-carrier-protein] synthase-3
VSELLAARGAPEPSAEPRATRRAVVLALGTALPPEVVTTTQIAERLGLEEEWIVSRTGIRSRRISPPGARLTDLAADAGAAALERAGVDAADLDLVLVATMTADEITPNAAPLVAERLGAGRAGAFDVGAACNAFLSALATGAAFVETDRARLVLVIGADRMSCVTDPDDRRTAPIFGDGAGAVVLGPARDGGVRSVVLRQDGSGLPHVLATRERGVIEMDGQETFRHAVNRLTEVTHEVLEDAGLTLEDVDLFVYHQANQRITRAIGQRLGLDPERVVDCIEHTGNTSAATLPLALADAEAAGRLRPGSRVLLGAFGAGFVWGGALLEWGA